MENSSDEGGISDKLVLQVTVLSLLGIFMLLPVFQAFAQTAQRGGEDLVIVSLAGKDYSVLLSSLFGRVGRDVPDSAYKYVKNIDEYRFRIARSVEENDRLVNALYARVETLPKKLAEGYREEIDELTDRVVDLKIGILPYVENDAFLSRAVVMRYGLYTSFVERLIDKINIGESFEDLNRIRVESFVVRKEIALLYQKINAVVSR